MTYGSTCVMADFLDTRTGKIVSGSFSNSGWQKHHRKFKPIEFRRDSRLIVFAGGLQEKPPVGWHLYVLDDGALRHLRTIETGGDFRKRLRL